MDELETKDALLECIVLLRRKIAELIQENMTLRSFNDELGVRCKRLEEQITVTQQIRKP